MMRAEFFSGLERSWRERAHKLHRWLVIRVGRYSPFDQRDAEKLVWALVGEVGEVAQLFYKRDRDKMTNDEFRAKIRAELADVRIYLTLLTEAVSGDETRDTVVKLDEVEKRWTPKGYVP